jgi:3-hydroxybutyryl-CoA dehydrogenase
MPMINEAIHAFSEGISDAATIDQIMKLGMAHPMGPLQLADYIGLDVCKNILDIMQEGFNDDKYAPCPLLVSRVQEGNLGIKTGAGFYKY